MLTSMIVNPEMSHTNAISFTLIDSVFGDNTIQSAMLFDSHPGEDKTVADIVRTIADEYDDVLRRLAD